MTRDQLNRLMYFEEELSRIENEVEFAKKILEDDSFEIMHMNVISRRGPLGELKELNKSFKLQLVQFREKQLELMIDMLTKVEITTEIKYPVFENQ